MFITIFIIDTWTIYRDQLAQDSLKYFLILNKKREEHIVIIYCGTVSMLQFSEWSVAIMCKKKFICKGYINIKQRYFCYMWKHIIYSVYQYTYMFGLGGFLNVWKKK